MTGNLRVKIERNQEKERLFKRRKLLMCQVKVLQRMFLKSISQKEMYILLADDKAAIIINNQINLKVSNQTNQTKSI